MEVYHSSSHSELETYSMKVTGNDGGEWKHMAGDGSAEYGRKWKCRVW
jgi:hypothetical protein